MDQRGSGRSRPLAGEHLDSLTSNTTAQLIADPEEVRVHLGIDRWLLWGVSWGTTLAIAYGAAHPDRVMGVVLTGGALTSRRSTKWITETVGMIFPYEWAAFEGRIPPPPRRARRRRLLPVAHRPDPAVRRQAAADWCRWEGAQMSLGPGLDDSPLFEGEPELQLMFATLVTHYWSHDGFLDHDRLLAELGGLGAIPCVMVHGRYEVSGPAGFPYEIAQAWPGSELILVDEGHGGPEMTELTAAAIDRLGRHSG